MDSRFYKRVMDRLLPTMMASQWSEARDIIETEFRNDPAALHYWRGAIQERTGDTEGARQQYAECLQIDPSDVMGAREALAGLQPEHLSSSSSVVARMREEACSDPSGLNRWAIASAAMLELEADARDEDVAVVLAALLELDTPDLTSMWSVDWRAHCSVVGPDRFARICSRAVSLCSVDSLLRRFTVRLARTCCR